MTSPSRRKRRTTPPNTSLTLSALAVLFAVCCSSAPAEDAAKVDRSTRAAAERRWQELKLRYAPASRQPVVEVTRPAAKPLRVTPVSDSPATTGRETQTPAPSVSDSPIRWRATAQPIRPQSQDLSEGSTERPDDEAALTPAPVVPQTETDRSPTMPLFQDPGDGPQPTVEERVAEATQLRPLSSIVPRADYAPAGGDCCMYLCPRPEGCPDEAESQTRCPSMLELPPDEAIARVFAPSQYAWAAANITYNPLYFEDASLERYGQLYPEWVQPFASMGLFTVQFASLPYQMAIDPVHSCVTPLGFYRPGEPAPCLKKSIPWNTRAAVEASAVYTGLIFLVP